VIVEGGKRLQPGLVVDPPLVIYRADGTYTLEVAAMFEPGESEILNFKSPISDSQRQDRH
jgi:tRNA1(Val) A37 N6-methylase TrmN6